MWQRYSVLIVTFMILSNIFPSFSSCSSRFHWWQFHQLLFLPTYRDDTCNENHIETAILDWWLEKMNRTNLHRPTNSRSEHLYLSIDQHTIFFAQGLAIRVWKKHTADKNKIQHAVRPVMPCTDCRRKTKTFYTQFRWIRCTSCRGKPWRVHVLIAKE